MCLKTEYSAQRTHTVVAILKYFLYLFARIKIAYLLPQCSLRKIMTGVFVAEKHIFGANRV